MTNKAGITGANFERMASEFLTHLGMRAVTPYDPGCNVTGADGAYKDPAGNRFAYSVKGRTIGINEGEGIHIAKAAYSKLLNAADEWDARAIFVIILKYAKTGTTRVFLVPAEVFKEVVYDSPKTANYVFRTGPKPLAGYKRRGDIRFEEMQVTERW